MQPFQQAHYAVVPKWEGKIPWLYMDSHKPDPLATAGIGCAINGLAESLTLGWTVAGVPATAAQITADWRRVNALPGGRLAKFYRAPGCPELPEASIATLVQKRYDAFTRMANAFSELRGNPLENPDTSISSAKSWITDLFSGGTTAAGVSVNETTAMQLATVYSCVNVIASDISSLPLKVYQQNGKGKIPAEDSDLYYLLGYRTHWVILPVDANADGKAAIEVFPSLREQPSDGTPLVFSSTPAIPGCSPRGPLTLFRLADNKRNWSNDFTRLTRLSFGLQEFR